MVRKGSLVLWLGLLLTSAGAAAATPIQYNVNISGGDDSITGIITTKGNLGLLVPADFLGYDLIVKEGSKSFELTGLNSQFFWFGIQLNGYDPITATATGLFEDFNPADGTQNESSVVLQANDQSVSVNGHVLVDEANPNAPDGYFFHTDPNSGQLTSFISEPAELLEFGAVAATPLPAALPMFAVGLGFVGYLAKRRRRRAEQVTA
jgi:hypothetical protein